MSKKILAIVGSPRKSGLIGTQINKFKSKIEELNQSEENNVNLEVIQLSDYNIEHCNGCDSCLRKPYTCPFNEKDDMPKIEEKMKLTDGIIIAAPSYFKSVPGVLKDMINRSRPMKMLDHQLKDKVFGAITYAGLRFGGQEPIIEALHRYALSHGMVVVGAVGSPVKDGNFGAGSLQTDEGGWRFSAKDQLAIEGSMLLGQRVAEVAKQLKKSE